MSPQDPGDDARARNHARVRRNLRIIGLCLAAYYFISAGWGWYQESRTVPPTTPAVAGLPDQPEQLLARWVEYVQRSDLITAEADGCITVSDAARRSQLEIFTTDGRVTRLLYTARYARALDETQEAMVRALLKTAEGTADERLIGDLLGALGFTPQNPDLRLTPGTLTRDSLVYAVAFAETDAGRCLQLTVTRR